MVDAQHPWPWLDPFGEATAQFFNGRDDDAQALLRGVLASPVCVLFGKSGLGKTSLLQAGLFPLLRARRMLPVAVRRFEHGPDAAALSTQLLRALDDAVAQAGLRWSGAEAQPPGDDVARLWERLHDHQQPLRDAEGRRWTPVFVLDQFEEVFTLQTDEQRQHIFPQLGDLLENRVPPSVEQRLQQHDALIDRIDPDSQPYRVLIALREDFLPELEVWSELIPRLGPNRCRLLPMSPAQALEAVAKTGGELLDPPSAQRIVDFLGRDAANAGAARVARESRQIEPALLSLVCASLNADRLALEPPGARIDAGGLESRGARILDRFYDEAFAGLADPARKAAARWVENDLITENGTRRPYPLSDLDETLRAAMRHLVDRRLLRVENTEQGDQVELVHDRLATVAQQRARASKQLAEAADRLQREKAAAEARLLAERASAESRRAEEALAASRRQRRLTVAAGALASAALIAAAWAVNETAKATRALADERWASMKRAEAEEALRMALDRAENARAAAEKALQAAQLLMSDRPERRAEATTLLSGANSAYASTAIATSPVASCPSRRPVFPQVGDAADLAAVAPIAKALSAAGFEVQKTEVVPRRNVPSAIELRYFRRSEEALALEAAGALAQAGMPGVPARYVRGYEDSKAIRPCQLEIWLPLGAGR